MVHHVHGELDEASSCLDWNYLGNIVDPIYSNNQPLVLATVSLDKEEDYHYSKWMLPVVVRPSLDIIQELMTDDFA